MDRADFDVAIIGGGPAGSSMAAYLAKAGVDCAVFEREIFPRPHVGESMVPSSTRVFRELDFIDVMEKSRFPHKFGAVWTASGSSRIYGHEWEGLHAEMRADLRFDERDQEGVDRPYTFHVDRGKFDTLLLQQAHGFGAKVFEGVSVKHVDFGEDGVTLTYGMGRRDATTTAKMVVDASGRRTVVGNQLKWRIKDPVFDQYAIHTWFEGYDRRAMAYREDIENYIYVHFLPITNSWIWQIPITDTVTSIGVVTQKKNFAKSRIER